MKIDFDLKFLNPKTGKPFDGQDAPLHLGDAASTALLTGDANERDFETKARAYKLHQRVYKGGILDLTPEEATAIKVAMGKIYTPVICGQAEAALNGQA